MNASGKSLVLIVIVALFWLLPMSAYGGKATDSVTCMKAQASLIASINAPDSVMSPGTVVRAITLANGFATVDFSRAFKDNFRGGDTREINMINGVLENLGKYPAISHVQILVDGKMVESVGGLIVISEPLDVIRTGHVLNHGS